MKDMNQLNENQAFKMVINAVDLAENEDDLNAVHDYVADALGQVNLHSEIFNVSSRKGLKEGDQGIDDLRNSIQRFADVESKTILEQQMVHQIQQMNDSYKEMIEEFHNNKDQIAARQNKLSQIKDEDRLNQQLINTTSQHTSNEVEEQIYHLNGRLKLQLLDEVKSVYNSQMTQNSDFNEEKKISSKTYLDQIHQRLYLEQSLITERIKKYFNTQLEEQVAPIIKKLNNIHVLVKADFNIEPDVEEAPFLRIDLNEMVGALPKQLTKRKLLNPNSQRDIQEQISDTTLKLLQNGMSAFKQQLDSYVHQMSRQAEDQFKELEQHIQEQIDELLSFKLDDSLIQQLETKSKQLDEIL